MNPSIIVLLLIAATDLYLSWKLVWPWLDSMRNAEKRRVEDVSGTLDPPPDAVGEVLGKLSRLGFTRLGEEKTYVGSLGEAVSWHMVDGTQTIAAEIAPYKKDAIAQFSTMLTDDTVVTTSYRIGESFSTPRYLAATCRTSIEDTLALHRTNLEAFLQRHPGTLRTVSGLADLMEIERIYRARHFRRYLRPPLVRSLLMVIAMNIAVAGAIISYYMVRNSPPFSPLIVPVMVVGFIALIVMFVFYARIMRHAG